MSLGERIACNLRRDYFNSVINKDTAFFDEQRTGALSKCSIFARVVDSNSDFICDSFAVKLGHPGGARCAQLQHVNVPALVCIHHRCLGSHACDLTSTHRRDFWWHLLSLCLLHLLLRLDAHTADVDPEGQERDEHHCRGGFLGYSNSEGLQQRRCGTR